MLSREENELLTRVAGDVPAGRMLRCCWLPALWSETIAHPDHRSTVRVLGEDMVACRNTNGSVAVDNVDGRSYPAYEAGGLVWVYLGTPERRPPFPAYHWTALPRDRIAYLRFVQRTNYLQALEGAMDSAHTAFLHRGFAFEEAQRAELSTDRAPHPETEDTPYGFRYAAIRRTNDRADTHQWVKTTLFAFPAISFAPQPMAPNTPAIAQYFIPIDDEHTMHYSIVFSLDGRALDEAAMRRDNRLAPGTDLDANFHPRGSSANWWNQDRAAMKRGSWCGIEGFPLQDAACQESAWMVRSTMHGYAASSA